MIIAKYPCGIDIESTERDATQINTNFLMIMILRLENQIKN